MTSTTRSCSSLWIGRRARQRLVAACLAAAVALGWTAIAAPADAPKVPAGPGQVVTVKGGLLTVDLRGAELADVLFQVARAAGFHLTTTGELGRVTVAFSARTVEDGLRRLVQDHEMMLVYGPAGRGAGPAVLMEVQIFSSTPGGGVAAAPAAGDAGSGAAARAEITGLVRARDTERGVPRLTELLTTSSDSVVRGRAVWGLSMLGGPEAVLALSGALRDQSPSVRGQAAQALRRAAGVEAIPALSGTLASDPDVSVRRAVARALTSLGTPEADAALSAAANDSDQLVRDAARRAMDRHNTPSR